MGFGKFFDTFFHNPKLKNDQLGLAQAMLNSSSYTIFFDSSFSNHNIPSIINDLPIRSNCRVRVLFIYIVIPSISFILKESVRDPERLICCQSDYVEIPVRGYLSTWLFFISYFVIETTVTWNLMEEKAEFLVGVADCFIYYVYLIQLVKIIFNIILVCFCKETLPSIYYLTMLWDSFMKRF